MNLFKSHADKDEPAPDFGAKPLAQCLCHMTSLSPLLDTRPICDKFPHPSRAWAWLIWERLPSPVTVCPALHIRPRAAADGCPGEGGDPKPIRAAPLHGPERKQDRGQVSCGLKDQFLECALWDIGPGSASIHLGKFS